MALRAAYCDVDGTLTATTIVTPLIWYKRRLSNPVSFRLWMLSLAVRGPWWLLIDRFNRGASNRAIYSNYRGLSREKAESLGGECYAECLRPRLMSGAAEKLAKFKHDGIAIVLVTGGLDFIMQPLAKEFGTACIAPRLLEKGGAFTGELDRPALTGKFKADAVREHARANGVDLAQSFALGDAFGDLEMLECVGNPIAVSPDSRLKKIAHERKWCIEYWSR